MKCVISFFASAGKNYEKIDQVSDVPKISGVLGCYGAYAWSHWSLAELYMMSNV